MTTESPTEARPTGFGPLQLDDRPITRRDLQFAPFDIEGTQQVWVRDEALGQTHVLSMHEIDVLAVMTGEQSFREIIAEIRSRFVVDDGPLIQFCERLEWRFLILTQRNRESFAMMERWTGLRKKPKRHQYDRVPARDVADAPFVVDPELRHDCHHSGHCCRQYAIVLTDDKLAPLSKHRFRSLPAERQGAFSDPAPPKQGEPQTHVLKRTEGDWCHFHVGDRCAVHAEMGPRAKPIPCQLFPIDLVHTPQGIRPYLLHECATLHESFASGTPIREKEEELRQVLRDEPQMVLRKTPESVYVLESLKVSFEAYRMLLWRMRASLGQGEEPEAWWTACAANWNALLLWYELDEELEWAELVSGLPHHEHTPDREARCASGRGAVEPLYQAVHMLSTLHTIRLVRNLNASYVDLPRFERELERLMRRLEANDWPLLAVEQPETANYLRRFLLNFIDSHQLLYYATACDGMAMLRLLWLCIASSVESARAGSELGELALVHKELAWWLTLFRFDEVRAALSDTPSALTEGLLRH